jgi:hypothetical protein
MLVKKNRKTVKHCISYSQTSRKSMVQLEGRSCIIFSLSLATPKIGKANKNVSE